MKRAWIVLVSSLSLVACSSETRALDVERSIRQDAITYGRTAGRLNSCGLHEEASQLRRLYTTLLAEIRDEREQLNARLLSASTKSGDVVEARVRPAVAKSRIMVAANQSYLLSLFETARALAEADDVLDEARERRCHTAEELYKYKLKSFEQRLEDRRKFFPGIAQGSSTFESFAEE